MAALSNRRITGNSLKASWRDIAISLAGTLQAVSLVEQLAKTGYLNTAEMETAVKSLFVTSPQTSLSPYGNISNLLSGLESLEEMLIEYKHTPATDKFRYALGVMHIQKRLSTKRDILGVIANRLNHAAKQAEHFGYLHDNLISNIADIYSDTISKFQYRIQVTGNYHYLQQDRVANQVRTLLLAAIRSSMLWRQLGGSRWQFVFYRSHIIDNCRALIKEAKEQDISGAA